MFRLDSLPALVKKRKRVGRGGSRGGTSGKGHKGQKARSGGYVRITFEGGQMPLLRRVPKRGFNNVEFAIPVKTINLKTLETFFQDGQEITKELLIERGVLKEHKSKQAWLLKVLGDGQLTKKFIVNADRFSKAASEAIEKVGGQARIIK
jgi:large subunit ribosomal protein L15